MFYSKNENYNPVFNYNRKWIYSFYNKKPDTKYLTLAIKIVVETLWYYGSDENYWKRGGPFISKKEISIWINKYLLDHKLQNFVKFIFM